jgi:hypothetical protein
VKAVHSGATGCTSIKVDHFGTSNALTYNDTISSRWLVMHQRWCTLMYEVHLSAVAYLQGLTLPPRAPHLIRQKIHFYVQISDVFIHIFAFLTDPTLYKNLIPLLQCQWCTYRKLCTPTQMLHFSTSCALQSTIVVYSDTGCALCSNDALHCKWCTPMK